MFVILGTPRACSARISHMACFIFPFSHLVCACVCCLCVPVWMWLAHLFIFISQLSWYFIIYAHFLLNIYVNAEFKPLVVYPFSMSPPCSRTTSHHIVTISLYGVFMLLSVQILQWLFFPVACSRYNVGFNMCECVICMCVSVCYVHIAVDT